MSTTSSPAVDAKSQIRLGIVRERNVVLSGAVLVALIVAISAAQPSFLSSGSLTALATQASLILLIAVGQTLVILMGSFDLAVAAIASFGAVLLAKWLPGLGWGAPVLVIVIATALAALNGWIFAWFKAPSFIITLGALGLWSGLAATISKGNSISVLGPAYSPVSWAYGNLFGIPRSVILAVAVTVIVFALMRWTELGRQVYAIGNAERAAVLSGIRVTRVKVLVFAISGLCAGLTAVALVAQSYSGAADIGSSLLLPSITAVVIGGTAITGGHGGLVGTVIGALIVATLRVGLSVAGIDPQYEQIFYGVILVLAVVLTTDRARLVNVK